MPTKIIILFSACLLMMAAACSSTEDQTADPDPTSGPSDDAGGPGAVAEPLDVEAADQESEGSSEDDPSADSAVDRVTAVFLEVESLASRLAQGDLAEVAQCMSDAGFPQLMELEADSQATAILSSDDANRLAAIAPGEMGPYTESHAREFGLIGSVARVRPGVVRSNDPAYDRQFALCEATARGDYSQLDQKEVDALLQAISDMRHAIRSQFIARATPGLEEILSERITCLLTESGHEYLDPEAFAVGESWAGILQRFGVQPGETRIISQSGEELDSAHVDDPLPRGETRMVPSAEMPTETYYPSAEEVELALAYVRCGEQINFVERLEELQIPIRAEILAEFEIEILGLRERVLELAEEV